MIFIPFSSAKRCASGKIFTSRISDIRESPTKPLAVTLRDSGCNVFAWDPYVSIENRPTDFTEWVDEPKDAEGRGRLRGAAGAQAHHSDDVVRAARFRLGSVF